MAMLTIKEELSRILNLKAGEVLLQDILCWVEWYKNEKWLDFPTIPKSDFAADAACRIFAALPEFRNLFDYRIKALEANLVGWRKDIFPRSGELHIGCLKIGPRFRIQHGNGTWIFAQEIGSDFFVGHGVTIGSHKGIPRIANRVTIRTGAVVVGPITIGDDAYITANSVVSRDMPENSIAYAPRTIIVQRR